VEQHCRRQGGGLPVPGAAGRSGLPVQFVIKTTEPFENLNTLAQQIMDKARADKSSTTSTPT
jgi:hypothetical protein